MGSEERRNAELVLVADAVLVNVTALQPAGLPPLAVVKVVLMTGLLAVTKMYAYRVPVPPAWVAPKVIAVRP